MTASKPLITVITVVRNSARLLEKTIQSVIGQSFPSVEYIIVDGASTDGTADIIKKYEPSLAKWVSEKDNGIYHAMNKGVSMAGGTYICFMNSGDVFADDRTLEKVVAGMDETHDADIYYGNILVKTGENELKERIATAPCNKHRMFFCHQSAFVRIELLRKYPFDEKYKMSADLKFFKQCYYNRRRFVHLDFPVVVYDTSGISHTNRIAGLRENIAVIREMDHGCNKFQFMLRLYYVIWWLKLTGKRS